MTKDKEFTIIVLQNLGLQIDSMNNVVDGNLGVPLQFKGRYIKFNPQFDAPTGRDSIELNLYKNSMLFLHLLFDYFNKLEEEEDKYISMLFLSNSVSDTFGYAQCLEDNTPVQSATFVNDCVKYADLLAIINGSDRSIYKDYDRFFSEVKNGNNIK